MTENDLCTQITIETSSPTDTLVEIDGIIVRQDQLLCLLDGKKFLNDDVSTPSHNKLLSNHLHPNVTKDYYFNL